MSPPQISTVHVPDVKKACRLPLCFSRDVLEGGAAIETLTSVVFPAITVKCEAFIWFNA